LYKDYLLYTKFQFLRYYELTFIKKYFSLKLLYNLSNKSFNTIEEYNSVRQERSEEHTSELQSRFDLVCRLLLEKKKKRNNHNQYEKKTEKHEDKNEKESTDKAR